MRDTNALSLPAEWGYSFSRIEDVNNDGLQDILAFAESPANNVGGTAIFVSMIQKADGTFEISPAFPAEPLITNRKGELFAGNLWHDYKFSLEDLDGDKDLDLYWGQGFGGYQSYFKDGIFLNDGTGHFFRDTSIGNLIANQVTWSGNSGAKTYMSDLDFDGIGDFLVFDSDWSSGQMLTTVRAFYSSNVSNYSSIHFGGLRKYYDLEISSSNIKIVDQLMTDGIAYMARDGRVVFQDIAIAFDLEGISGNAARLLAAVFGKDAVKNPTYAGIAISLFDQGYSKDQVSQVALNAVFGADAKSKDVVSLIWKNLTGSTIDDKNLADLSGLIDSKAITAAQLTTKAADLDLTAQLIDLVGLSKTGWEYIPYGE